MKVDQRLVRGLDSEDKELILSSIRSSKFLREMLIKVLTEEIESAIIHDESVDLLESPNALATLARSLGYRKGLRHCIDLLTTEVK